MSISRKHQYFIDRYTTPNQSGFLNATESYRLTYPGITDPTAEANSARLMKREHIRLGVAKALEPLYHLSKEDYLVKLEEELKNCTAPATRARLLELIGRVHGFARENEVSTTVNNIHVKDLRNILDERHAMLERSERPTGETAISA